MNKKLITMGAVAVAVTPALALAQNNPGNLGTVAGFINNLLNFANNTLVPALFAIIFLYFAFGMFQMFVQGKQDAAKRSEGVTKAINAIIGVVLILSFWGLVNLLSSGFGFSTQAGEIRTPGIVPGASTRN